MAWWRREEMGGISVMWTSTLVMKRSSLCCRVRMLCIQTEHLIIKWRLCSKMLLSPIMFGLSLSSLSLSTSISLLSSLTLVLPQHRSCRPVRLTVFPLHSREVLSLGTGQTLYRKSKIMRVLDMGKNGNEIEQHKRGHSDGGWGIND